LNRKYLQKNVRGVFIEEKTQRLKRMEGTKKSLLEKEEVEK